MVAAEFLIPRILLTQYRINNVSINTRDSWGQSSAREAGACLWLGFCDDFCSVTWMVSMCPWFVRLFWIKGMEGVDSMGFVYVTFNHCKKLTNQFDKINVIKHSWVRGGFVKHMLQLNSQSPAQLMDLNWANYVKLMASKMLCNPRNLSNNGDLRKKRDILLTLF